MRGLRRLRTSRGLALATALVLALAGSYQVASAGWIHAKALVAQALLEQAWARSDGDRVVRPWPWADTGPVARMAVPALGIDRVVLAGASGESLAFGPAKMAASAEPGRGHTVLAGHRDTHFAFLQHLQRDHRITLERRDGERVSYRVVARQVVDSRDRALALDGPNRLTLVTCYPFDAVNPGGPLRLVVTAEPVGRD
jgi:sortase A